MEVLFEFYPYKINRYVLPFATITMLVFLATLFLCFNLIILVFVLINAWLIKILHDSLHTKILFFYDGFRVHESKRKGPCDFSWDQVRYGYHTTNFKGHHFLLLAPNELNENQLRQYTNQGANSDRICIDAIVVFPIDNPQYTSELAHFIFSNVIMADR